MEELQSTDSDQEIPFKLCFSQKTISGRSNVQIGKPLNLPPIITEKFHTKKDEHNYDCTQKYIKMLTVVGPREKYEKPITENQKYGWYNDVRFNNIRDKRLNFHKHTDNLIMEHLMNYAKIRP